MRKTICLSALLLVTATSCGEVPTNEIAITQGQFGDAWPFTTSNGILKCENKAITFRTNTRTYGINGTAQGRGFPGPEAVWKVDPSVPGKRMDIGPILDKGLSLCQYQ